MRLSLIVLGAALVLAPVAASAQTPAPAAAAKPAFTTKDTLIGDILDNPAAKAILDKYLPEVSKGDQINMARGMTLKQIQPYAPDKITDKALADVDADFAKLPGK